MRILLVEDEPVIQELIVAILSPEGHEVETLDNGDQALRAYSDRKCSYELVLTGVGHPGMDGVELAAKIRQLNPSQRIAFQTGNATDSAVLDKRKRYGVMDIPTIGKPFSKGQLLQLIESAAATGSKGQ